MKKRLVTIALMLILLVSIMSTAAFAAAEPFADVPKTIDGMDNPFYDAIMWAVDKDITAGYADGTFHPDANCTRAHVVTFLWRAAGSPNPASLKNPFVDVERTSPFYRAILWAAEQGITTGYSDNTFRPNDPCTRAHVVTFLWRYNGQPTAKKSVSLNDINGLNASYKAAIDWAAEKGITTGYADGSFRPNAVCTRAHVVTFIYRDVLNTHHHSYTASVTDPTCTEAGYTIYTCSCGDSYKENYVDARGHSYTKQVAEPTCTEKGYTLYACECGESYKDDFVNAIGHSWDEGTEITAVSYTNDGLIRYTCLNCGETREETVPMLIVPKKVRTLTETTTMGNGDVMKWSYGHDMFGNIISGILTDKSGTVIGSMAQEYYDAPKGIPKEKISIIKSQTETIVYNEGGKVVSTTVVSSSGTLMSLLENTYNEAGLLAKSVKVDNSTGGTETEIFTYNSDGQLVKDVMTTEYRNGKSDEIITEFFYENGKMTGQKLTGTDTDGSKYTAEVECEYNAKGREDKRTTDFSMPGGLDYTLVFNYSYDLDGNLKKQVQKIKEKGGLIAVTFATYTYSYEELAGSFYIAKEKLNSHLSDEDSYTIEYTYEYK